jgi:hypothetical protein
VIGAKSRRLTWANVYCDRTWKQCSTCSVVSSLKIPVRSPAFRRKGSAEARTTKLTERNCRNSFRRSTRFQACPPEWLTCVVYSNDLLCRRPISYCRQRAISAAWNGLRREHSRSFARLAATTSSRSKGRFVRVARRQSVQRTLATTVLGVAIATIIFAR